MPLQLKLITCVYNDLLIGIIYKLMLTPAVLTSLNGISPIGLYLNVTKTK